jgi:hypothetical protein
MEPSEKLGVCVPRSWFQLHMKLELTSGEPSPQVLDETFFTLSHAMMFTRNLPYTETFKNHVNQLIPSGIIKKIQYKLHQKYIPEGKNEKIPPQVLTLEHLAVGFTIYLVASAFCVVIFFMEKIFSRFMLMIEKNFVHKFSNVTP